MSIATQIGRIAKAKKDIKEVVNQDFEIINNETIDEYAEKMGSAYDEYESYIPWEHGEGREFTFKKGGTGSYLKELEINGNTHQTTIAAETGKEVVGTSINVNDVNIEKENYVTLKGNTHQGRLPSEYTQVDYIESSGTQYIDTGININTTTSRYETKINPSSVSGTIGIFGTRNGSSANQSSMNVFIISGTFRLDWVSGNGNYNVRNISSDTEYTISITRGLATINNVNYTSAESSSIDSTYPFYIGSFNNVGSVFSTGFSGKIYYSKLYNNNILVFDGVPCYRKSDNEIGMYDLVSNTFFTNQGTGTFNVGPVVSIPIPNPDYPQDVRVVTGNNSVKITGKNLFDEETEIGKLEVDTSSENFGNPISSLDQLRAKNYIQVEPNTTYYGYYGYSAGTMYVIAYDENFKGIKSWSYKAMANLNITTPSNAKYIRFYLTAGYGTLYRNDIAVIKGTSGTYEPYQSQTYPINLGTMELCKIGDYQDYIYKENGKWYKHSEIYKYIIDNNTTLYSASSSSDGYARVGFLENSQVNFISNDVVSVFCNKFKAVSQNENGVSLTGSHWYCSNSQINNYRIMFRCGDSSLNIDQFINFLKTNNIIVYYILKTPTNEEITDTTLIEQLNALYTAQIYNPTFIETTTSNLLPYINLKYNVVTPSPSPERPSDIEVVSGDNIVNVHGKNLYYIEPQTKNGVTLSYDSDGAIVLNGTSNASFIQFHNVISLSGRNTLSVTNPTIQNNTFVRTRNESDILVHSITLENTALKTATKNGNIKTLEITIGAKDVVYNNFKIYAQLEQGSVASTYEPYHNKDYEIDLHGKNLLPNSESLSNTGQYQDVIRFTDLEPSTEYTLKVKGTAGDKFYTGGSMPYASLTIPSNGVLEFTFTTNSTISDLAIIKNTTATNTLPLTECTLCKGSTAIEYEEFYDYKLCKINDYKDKIDKSTGKNLFDISEITEESIDVNTGVKTTNTYYRLSDYIKVSPNTDYISSWVNEVTPYTAVRILYYDSNKTFISGISSGADNRTSYGFTTPTNTAYIRYNYLVIVNESPAPRKDIQIEKGSQATNYEPYGEQWYIKKEIGKVVLDGSEGWSFRTNIGFLIPSDRTTFSLRNINVYDGYCDKFKVQKNNSTWTYKYYCGWNSTGTFWIRDDYSIANNVDDFKTWLSTHNTIVYYVLATPTYEIITNETLINQLEELTKLDTYNNYSAVTATGDLINPELECVLFSQPAYQK